MNWLIETLTTPSSIQSIILISLVATLGLQLGRIKIFNISLGVTFVFFIGIFLGHINLDIDQNLLHFAQNFGLIIFIYALGLQVGPGFFSSLRSSGLKLNMLAMTVIAIGIVMTILMGFIFNISISNMVGLLCGAVTNTPALGAAQQTMLSMPDVEPKLIADMALATAIAYPMGVIGVILAIVIMNKMLVPEEIKARAKDENNNKPYVGEFEVTNLELIGKTIKELMELSPCKFIISRVGKGQQVFVAKSDTKLEINNHLMIIAKESEVKLIERLIGKKVDKDWNKEGIDWDQIDNSQLISKKILVTKKELNGKKLGALRIRNQYGVNITRVNRVGIQLLASPDLALQLGDSLTIVGEVSQIEKVSKELGDEVKELERPNLLAIFLGIALGLILGTCPFPIPGMSLPLKLGIAGGPIVVGILMGAFGPRFKITTYTTQSANLFMRQFGLVTYLACLGIDSGEHFFETVMKAEGLLWVALGFALTIIPVLIVGFIAMRILKLNYARSIGMLCGSMSNPIALSYADLQTDSDDPSVGYATVYPISTFVRIISAQILIIALT